MCLLVILSGLLFPIGQAEKGSHGYCLTIYEVSKMNKACWVRFSSKQQVQRDGTLEEILYFTWKLRFKILVFVRLLVQMLENLSGWKQQAGGIFQ